MLLLDLVRRTIREHDLARWDTRVLVALSGGSDSMALAYLMRELAAAGELQVAGAAHFNHQLRATAARDEQFCADVARALGWPLLAARADVAARAAKERRSMEDAARAARYEFFERARGEANADVVALGHTRDDQAETFLLRLMRGAGPRGLAAMYPRVGSIVRPLLDCRRAALRSYLDERRIGYVEDESNRDVAIPRNRVRAELLPLLETRFNAAITNVLAQESELARDEWVWMSAESDRLLRQVLRAVPDREQTWELDTETLLQAPRALRRLVLWRAMTDAAGGRQVDFEHVQAALELVEGRRPGIDGPGQRLERVGHAVVLMGRPPATTGRGIRANPANPANPANLFCYPLSIPGEVRLEEVGCTVSAEIGSAGGPGDPRLAGDRSVAVVSSDLCSRTLKVRNRRPGDRFRPLGLGGGKKLQDFFVDRKVDRRQRDLVPLVVDDHDRIVWVAGHGIDASFRVTDATKAVLILRLKRLGGTA